MTQHEGQRNDIGDIFYAHICCSPWAGSYIADVIVIIKNRTIGQTICAGGLTIGDMDFVPKNIVDAEFNYMLLHTAKGSYDLDLGNHPVFTVDREKLGQWMAKETEKAGALTGIANKDGSVVVQLHDNPASVINVRTKTAITVTFDLAEGVRASKEDNIIKIETDNLTAFIASTNSTPINISGGEVRIEPGSGNIIFRAVPVNMPVEGMHQRFMGEMMRNRAGAEISMGMSGKYSIVNYSENMNVMIKSMEKNRMKMTINSTDPSGKFVMMNIDNSSGVE